MAYRATSHTMHGSIVSRRPYVKIPRSSDQNGEEAADPWPDQFAPQTKDPHRRTSPTTYMKLRTAERAATIRKQISGRRDVDRKACQPPEEGRMN